MSWGCKARLNNRVIEREMKVLAQLLFLLIANGPIIQ